MRKFFVCVNLLLLLLTQTACTAESDCDIPRQEPLSASSSLHLLESVGAVWDSSPPTSGPHYPIAPAGGVYDFTLSPLEQVSFLESGGVIVQYHPNRIENNLGKLTLLANNNVIVSPNPTLDIPVIGTAWTWKISCKNFDTTALRGFITDYVGKAEASHRK